MPERLEWEYQVFALQGDFVGACNTAGKDGWELTFPVAPPPGAPEGSYVLGKRVKLLIEIAKPEEVRKLVLLGNSLANGDGHGNGTRSG